MTRPNRRFPRVSAVGMTRTRTRQIAWLAMMVVFSACGGAAVPSPAVLPPTAAALITPAPTPTGIPILTPAPAPTMTTDDLKIDSVVKDGIAAMAELSGKLSGAATVGDTLAIVKKMQSLADTQVTLTSIYTASTCTKDAWDLYKQGMGLMSSGVDATLAWIAAGAAGDMPGNDIKASATTLGSALVALKAPCSAAGPSEIPSSTEQTSAPTGFAAVETAFDTPGTLMTGGGAGGGAGRSYTPSFFAELWDLRRLALNDTIISAEIGTSPKPYADAFGHRIVRVHANGGPLFSYLDMVLNPADGSLRAIALETPSGGGGGELRYWEEADLFTLLEEVLLPGQNANVASGLGVADDLTTSRVGLDRSYDTGGLTFHFIGTANKGEWLIVTPTP